MKIMFLTTDITQVGGVERVISKLGNYFINKCNYEVDIISLYKKKNEDIYFDLDKKANIKYMDLESNNSDMSLFRRLRNQISLIVKINKKLKNEKFDLLITFNTMIGVAVALNYKNLKSKIIASEHGDYFYFGKVWRFARKKLYGRLDKVVVLTNNDKKCYGEFLKNVEVIPNPLSLETKKKSSLETKKIISIGRLEDEKGFDELIDIFKNISKDCPEWKLEIVGDGSQKFKLKQKIIDENLQDKICISDFTDKIEDKYLSASIFALTSRTEAFGLVLTEAMECGVPCISYDLTGPSEIINNNYDGYLISNRNSEEFEIKLRKLMSDTNLRKSMGIEARKNIQRFDINSIGKQWSKVVEDIMQGGK